MIGERVFEFSYNHNFPILIGVGLINVVVGALRVPDADSGLVWTLIVINWVAAAFCFLVAVWIYYSRMQMKREMQERE